MIRGARARVVLLLAFLVYVAVRIFREVFRRGRVTTHTVRGGLCLYLLIGLIWALGFAILESLSPGAFRHEDLVDGEAVIQVPPNGGPWLPAIVLHNELLGR